VPIPGSERENLMSQGSWVRIYSLGVGAVNPGSSSGETQEKRVGIEPWKHVSVVNC
jgi:hypothetical protein